MAETGRRLRRAVAHRRAMSVEGDAPGLTSPRFAGEPLLEACFRDRARMGVGTADSEGFRPVAKVQQALIDLGFDLGEVGADGRFGSKTAGAVRAFKREMSLGFEEFGDVGPGTMHRLNALFPPELPVCRPSTDSPPTPTGHVLALTDAVGSDRGDSNQSCNPVRPEPRQPAALQVRDQGLDPVRPCRRSGGLPASGDPPIQTPVQCRNHLGAAPSEGQGVFWCVAADGVGQGCEGARLVNSAPEVVKET